ncbi:MAG: CDP-alcohol phosphatidyltransferase family protein [Alphaproteobacteria bacterium]|jgi:cardiolipin synthase|nr:CDP-alcohol phosphatidyltransferase family protein [Alphaproteobacteria bacterium]MDP6564339.1 CDP-alcohol phosphatidyltransferase family protein [Alphaproteobacteria bacterium]MDP6815141.1 CDP-alcohol phosphatidyltransferase family protein [Alphaproteobacteria bacterium]
MNIPNIISLVRLLSVPLNVWLIVIGEWHVALAVFCLAGLSDAVDGLIAKRFDWQTRLGRYLDPIADKALLMSMYVTLGVQENLPAWLVLLVVSRDVLIVGGVVMLYAFDQPYEPKPALTSKINTGVQILLVAAIIGAMAFEPAGIEGFVRLLILAVAATTVVSGTEYLFDWWRRMTALEGEER